MIHCSRMLYIATTNHTKLRIISFARTQPPPDTLVKKDAAPAPLTQECVGGVKAAAPTFQVCAAICL